VRVVHDRSGLRGGGTRHGEREYEHCVTRRRGATPPRSFLLMCSPLRLSCRIACPPAPFGGVFSEQERSRHRDGRAVLAADVEAENTARRRTIHVHQLHVRPDVAGVETVVNLAVRISWWYKACQLSRSTSQVSGPRGRSEAVVTTPPPPLPSGSAACSMYHHGR